MKIAFKINPLFLTMVFFAFYIPKVLACQIYTGPQYIQNPNEVIKAAYFIGVVEVLTSEPLEANEDEAKFTVRLVQPYGHYPASGEITAIGTRAHSMCNPNAYKKPGKFIEAIILRQPVMQWWQKLYMKPEYKITTDSLGADLLKILRENSKEAEPVRQMREACKGQGGTWLAENTSAPHTLFYDCYKKRN